MLLINLYLHYEEFKIATQLLRSRLNRVVGDIPENCFEKIDGSQWILKPNSYSKKGF